MRVFSFGTTFLFLLLAFSSGIHAQDKGLTGTWVSLTDNGRTEQTLTLRANGGKCSAGKIFVRAKTEAENNNDGFSWKNVEEITVIEACFVDGMLIAECKSKENTSERYFNIDSENPQNILETDLDGEPLLMEGGKVVFIHQEIKK
jgi:hypothetical protein